MTELTFQAASGERNDVTIAYDGDGVVVSDLGAPLVAGRSCVRRDDGTVRCNRGKRADYEKAVEEMFERTEHPGAPSV